MNDVYAVASVSKQAYHKHLQKSVKTTALLENLIIGVDKIRAVHGGCGVEKLHHTLKPGWIGRDRFIECFMNLGYRVKKKKNYTRTTIPVHSKYLNLIQGLLVWDKNRLWQTDITYYYVNHRHCYIVFIIDIYTKVIRGYSVSENLLATANINALQMAIKSVGGAVKNLIHHSDRGSQYIDTRYITILHENKVYISMGGKAQENAYAERINGIIKNEYLIYKTITSFTQLKKEVKIAVEHYNNRRSHLEINKKIPMVFDSELIYLSNQNRPKVIVYADGNAKNERVSNSLIFKPDTEPQVHVCPIIKLV